MPYCPSCGTEVADNDYFCTECGTSVQTGGEPANQNASSASDSGTATPAEPATQSDTTRDSMFYVGAVLGVIGVLLFPYFFFLVALPEAILQLWNRSIQDSLPSDARNNPAVSGTLLIFRWFGNFLILVIVLALIGGVLLGLASL